MSKDTDTLMALNRIGYDDALIAKQLGVCIDTVQRRRSALGLPAYFHIRQGTFSELRAAALTAIALGCRMAA